MIGLKLCRYQSELVKGLFSREHKQALFGNPFLAWFLVIAVEYFFFVFCSQHEGISDAISNPPYWVRCTNSRR